MSLLSTPAQLALDRLLGRAPETPHYTAEMFSPGIEKIRDPLQDAALLAELEDEGTLDGQERNRRLESLPNNEGYALDEHGQPVYNGRRCCYDTVSTLASTIGRVPMGTEFECKCSAVYRVQRGAGRHG